MRPRDHISPEHLASIMELRAGELFWKARGETWFDARHAGRPVCLRRSARGYHLVRINGRAIAAHRAIWALQYGAWPAQYIDHINGVRTDNRIDNLRDVSLTINNLNTSRSRTGGGGVHWNKRDERWIAQIRRADRHAHLGSFATRDEAQRARRVAERLVYGMALESSAGGEVVAGGRGTKLAARRKDQDIARHDGSGL